MMTMLVLVLMLVLLVCACMTGGEGGDVACMCGAEVSTQGDTALVLPMQCLSCTYSREWQCAAMLCVCVRMYVCMYVCMCMCGR